jgi:hypothetical protein
MAERNKGHWGYDDASISSYIVAIRDSTSSRRVAIAALNHFRICLGSFINNAKFPKANLLWKQLKKDTTKEKAKRVKTGTSGGEKEFTDAEIDKMMTDLPSNAAGAIARMDFLLGRYVGLHGAYRVQVQVGDVHFSPRWQTRLYQANH